MRRSRQRAAPTRGSTATRPASASSPISRRQGLLVKTDDHVHSVGHCYRCHTVIEPWLSDQWFVDMKPLAEPAIEAVRDGRVTFHPKRWENVYFHWMENIRDWCISRQLWWGHRIPVFYCDECDMTIASMDDLIACPTCGVPVRQDEDVLDTWFSSQLWPFATLGWPDPTPRSSYFYPTSVLSTARDILFLWVARMVMSGMYFVDGNVPFDDVIIHPTVFNAEGKRMSKSLGTGVDPLDLMDHYGADGMRFGLMLQVTGAQDLKFAEDKLALQPQLREQDLEREPFRADEPRRLRAGRAGRRTRSPTLDPLAAGGPRRRASTRGSMPTSSARSLARSTTSSGTSTATGTSSSPRRAWPRAARRAASVQRILVFVLDQALRLLHPMMPFVTEAIWRNLPLAAS